MDLTDVWRKLLCVGWVKPHIILSNFTPQTNEVTWSNLHSLNWHVVNPPHPTTPSVAYHVTCVQLQRTSSSPTHPTPPHDWPQTPHGGIKFLPTDAGFLPSTVPLPKSTSRSIPKRFGAWSVYSVFFWGSRRKPSIRKLGGLGAFSSFLQLKLTCFFSRVSGYFVGGWHSTTQFLLGWVVSETNISMGKYPAVFFVAQYLGPWVAMGGWVHPMAPLKSSLRPYFWMVGLRFFVWLVRWGKFDVKIVHRLSLKLHQDILVKIAFKEVTIVSHLFLQVVLTGTPVFQFPVRDLDIAGFWCVFQFKQKVWQYIFWI